MASLRDILRRRLAAGFWPPRFRNLGEILGRILAAEISESRRDLGDILGRILAAAIQKARRPKSCRESRRDLGEIWVKILYEGGCDSLL